ncbi:g1909 [Coccomyxa viridis]|uniref:G1909 protein n=1 Tax=Coccomyxa viridis TaxID=1274662 RepID=A0ABP1FR14_9CHLO
MASACSALYFLNLKGDILIQRTYRDDVERNLAATFRSHILNSRDADNIVNHTPVRVLGSCSFMYMRHGDVYILGVTKQNANVMMAFRFMTNVVSLCKSYFGGEFSEQSIKNNFVLIYELLDEIMDFGYPQIVDASILKQYIFQKGFITEAAKAKREAEAQNATLQVTGAVGWRKDSIKYKKNEVFLDIVEQVNMLTSSKGTVLRCDVNGKIVMKVFLSGMPDVKLGLNDKLEDVTFHQCVNLGRFDAEKVVSFVPPDGEFELMKYRCQEGITLPFKVTPLITELGRTRMEVNTKVKAGFSNKLFALNVVITIPVPDTTASADMQTSIGKAKYDSKKHALVWKIKKFTGATEHSLVSAVELIATTREKKSWSRPPISMTFQVPMYSASGLRVQYLKVWEKSGYKVDKWVRKVCKSGDYNIRT